MTLEPTYSPEEVGESLGCSAAWVRKQVRSGVINPMRVGDHKQARIRLTAEDVEKLKVSMRRPEPVLRVRRRRRRAL